VAIAEGVIPGSLPVYNKTALEYAIKVALALNCSVQEYTKFDRKNYFYPDLPKNYQISQYDLPLSRKGFLDIYVKGEKKRIGITRVHMEEDAGKLIHEEQASLVDFNRAGIPLLEIVSEPDISFAQEAYEYLTVLKGVLEYLDVSDCDMEKGSLRCDANVSIRQKGDKELGTKAELKNMNSFKAVRDALAFEIERQEDVLESGEKVIQETRLWDAESMSTVIMRTKEEAKDYRYFPEPDLPPFIVSDAQIEEIKASIPELPYAKAQRLMREYAISENDAKLLVTAKSFANYAEALLKLYPEKDKKPVVNWLIGPILSEANLRNRAAHELSIPGGDQELLKIIGLTREGKISHLVAKAVLTESLDTGKYATKILEEKNLFQVSDSESLEAVADQVIKENAKSAEDFKQGKANALMFLVGQVMRKTSGKANPQAVQEILKRRLGNA